jgi:hypothetical protein
MYYQIEGRMNMKTLTFDEEGLTVGKQSYPIDDIENLKIASAPLFATYGILTFRSGGRDISVAFPRSAIDKLRRAMHDFEHEQMMRKKAAEKAAAEEAEKAAFEAGAKEAASQASQTVRSAASAGEAGAPQDISVQGASAPAAEAMQTSAQPVRYMDPYEEVKKLKELLDMGIVTEEEFQKKKKELLKL